MELVLLVGLQASGKSTFYGRHLAGTHVLVSRDRFRGNPNPRRRQARLLEEALAAGRDVCLDNTNATRSDRAEPIALARRFGAATACYFFPPDVRASIARNARREGKERVPVVAILATAKRMQAPEPREGFDRLFEVRLTKDGAFDVAESSGLRRDAVAHVDRPTH